MAQTQPNVIWVLTDQQRAMMLSCNGDPNVHTPNIDALADMGVNFTRAVSGYPLCCPFRGSMLTKPLSARVRARPRVPDAAGDADHRRRVQRKRLPHRVLRQVAPGRLPRAGGARGPAHGPARAARHFQQWVGYENNNSQYDCWVHGGQGETAFCRRLPGYETDSLTDLLLEHLEERAAAKTPFFAVLSVQPPHDPYLAPPEYMARFNPQTLRMRENVPHIPALEERARREYAGACAMVENMDWNMGRIRNKLWETGLAENTHILFFSDHGDMHGSHGMFLKTHPYEESLRIPFVIGGASHYTGVTRARVDYPINHVDIAPTTLGLCGIRPPEWMQGTDYSAARLGGTVQNAPDSAYIQKNVETPTGYGTQFPWRGIVTRDGWKYVCLAGTPYLMFNLNEDPLEQHNMALNSFFSEKRRELNERLRRWVEETGDDFLLPKL